MSWRSVDYPAVFIGLVYVLAVIASVIGLIFGVEVWKDVASYSLLAFTTLALLYTFFTQSLKPASLEPSWNIRCDRCQRELSSTINQRQFMRYLYEEGWSLSPTRCICNVCLRPKESDE